MTCTDGRSRVEHVLQRLPNRGNFCDLCSGELAISLLFPCFVGHFLQRTSGNEQKGLTVCLAEFVWLKLRHLALLLQLEAMFSGKFPTEQTFWQSVWKPPGQGSFQVVCKFVFPEQFVSNSLFVPTHQPRQNLCLSPRKNEKQRCNQHDRFRLQNVAP